MQAALRIEHEVFQLQGDDAFLGGVGQFQTKQPGEEKLAEILLVGGQCVFERGSGRGFINVRFAVHGGLQKAQS